MSIRITRKGALITLLIAAVIAGGALTAYRLLNKREKGAVFFYPRMDMMGLASEHRVIPLDTTGRETLEQRLIREYMLGPISTALAPAHPDQVRVRSVFIYTNRSAAIDFSPELISFIDAYTGTNRNRAGLFVEGLCETLRQSTGVRRVLILSEGKPVFRSVHGLILAKPLALDLVTKKVKKKSDSI